MKKILAALLVSMGLLQSTALLAGVNNSIALSDDPAAVVGGQTMITATWTDNGATSNSLQFDIVFDNAAFTFNNCAVQAPYNAGPYVTSCMQPAGMPNRVRLVTFRIPSNPIASGDVIIVTFDVNGPPGMYQMTVQGVVTGDAQPTDTDPANITVLGPSYSSNPAPGPINFGSVTQGDPDLTENLEISNNGEMGTTLTGSCSLSGPQAGTFSLSPNNSFSVLAGNPPDVTTITCDSAQAVMAHNATLTCMHNGGSPGPASPVQYALSCNILMQPSPEYGSMPAPGSAINFGTLTTLDPPADEMLAIENIGNEDGLDGACSITTNPNMAYGIDSMANYGPLAQMGTAMRTVTCDTSIPGNHNGGVLSCTHNGTAIPSPATYALNCVVNGIPTYDSTPGVPGPLVMNTDQGDGDATTSLLIENIGEPNSTLTGTCGLMGDPQISISGSAAFSLGMGATDNIDLLCDDAAQGLYSSTLTCAADVPASNAGDFVYNVECTVDPPDPAIYNSTPYNEGNPGDLIDVNEGNPPPPVGGTQPSTVLTIMNAAAPGDDFLDLDNCSYAGHAAITANPPSVSNDLNPGQSVNVTFNCATTTDGTFMGTYTCPFNDNPSLPPPPAGPDGGVMSPATYPVECVVREQFSDVEESPPSGTPQTADLMPGDSASWDFQFEEILGEGLDGILNTCGLVGDPAFGITTSTVYPQNIPSGGPPLVVSVGFTDPGVGDTFTTTLNCTFTDNPDGGEPEQTMVSWPIEVTVTGRNATFLVTKDFSDDNPAGVQVFLECNTGLPLQQQAVIHDPEASGLEPGDFTHVEFVVVDFEPGTMDCDVTESEPLGYIGSYYADYGEDGVAGSVFDDEEGCHYEDVESADFICEITNTLQTVDVVVEKEWIDENPQYLLPTWVEVTLRCDAPILYGYYCGGGYYCISQFIDPNNPGEFEVLPHFEGTSCSVTEAPEVGVLQDVSDCAALSLLPGHGDSCVIVNTRLYAGIPTLSQYGLLLMALLMLGVGLIAYRRYA